MRNDQIARICHEANRAFCLAMGDNSQVPWDDAPDWVKSSALNGVDYHIGDPDASPAASHQNWLEQKRKEGWAYGPVKDVERKKHPCFLPYDDLPMEQKAKDYIFRAIVHACLDADPRN